MVLVQQVFSYLEGKYQKGFADCNMIMINSLINLWIAFLLGFDCVMRFGYLIAIGIMLYKNL